MKKLKYILFLSLIFLFSTFIFNFSYAEEESITGSLLTTNNNEFFFEKDGVYYWKKQLDETKVPWYVKSTYYDDEFQFYNSFFDYYGPTWLYYEIDLGNDIPVEYVKDYLWNDTNFEWKNNWDGTSKIFIYYSTFLNEFENDEWSTIYTWKYESEDDYTKIPKDIKIIQEWWIETSFLFKWYIPNITIKNDVEDGYIILNENNQIIIEWDENFPLEKDVNIGFVDWGSFSYEQENNNIILTPYYYWEENKNMSIENIIFFGDYDFHRYYNDNVKKRILSKNICKYNEKYEPQIRWDNKIKIFPLNEWTLIPIIDIGFDIQKYQNNKFEAINNIATLSWNEINFQDFSDWLYKINFKKFDNEESILCKKYYNYEQKNILNLLNFENNIFYQYNWIIYPYSNKLSTIFPNIKYSSFEIGNTYKNIENIFDEFSIELKDEDGISYYQWWKECINSYDCYDNMIAQADIKYANEKIFKKSYLEINYKDIYWFKDTIKMPSDVYPNNFDDLTSIEKIEKLEEEINEKNYDIYNFLAKNYVITGPENTYDIVIQQNKDTSTVLDEDETKDMFYRIDCYYIQECYISVAYDKNQPPEKILFYYNDEIIYEEIIKTSYEIANFSYNPENEKTKISENGFVNIKYYLGEKNENLDFALKILLDVQYDNSNWSNHDLTVWTQINIIPTNNETAIDKSKIFVCSTNISNIEEISKSSDCISLDKLESLWYQNNGINILNIYWLTWSIGENFWKLKINFKFDFWKAFMPV